MVMWMSRKERKRKEKRRRRLVIICIFIQVLLLAYGLLLVDSQIRTTLGIDGISLISYEELEGDKYSVNIMGNSHIIDIYGLRGRIGQLFAQLREMSYSIRKGIR